MNARPLIRIPRMRLASGAAAPAGDIDQLIEFLRAHPRLLVLGGAGLSTTSGIPAYRDGDGRWLRRDPILYQDFIASETARRRYWARSYFGWRLMRAARPNGAHRSLVDLERAGRISLLVTQNVDGLHCAAGSQRLVELHGSLARVRCLSCGEMTERDALQERLERDNPGWNPEVLGYNPDGDAELDADAYPGFRIASCVSCGGALKPDVVFFGESVPAERVARIREAMQHSDAVLVLGSSLVVMSGYRIVREAAAAGLPVVAINQGRTRADDLLRFKIDGDCTPALAGLAGLLDPSAAESA
ncbi:MAG: NAD-dependent protein deacetylase [Wenzhouxiangella sp.]|nr:MAG: NAD-dependent protein deacetylase [Wenzhouxiangella sp.]